MCGEIKPNAGFHVKQAVARHRRRRFMCCWTREGLAFMFSSFESHTHISVLISAGLLCCDNCIGFFLYLLSSPPLSRSMASNAPLERVTQA